MDKDNNGQNDQPTDEKEPSDETQVEYREISEEQLKQILEDHKKWVDSDGKEGGRADLSRANLQQADLEEANLQRAIISGANLQQADLEEANLQQAYFTNANLQKANLRYANLGAAIISINNFKEADLRDANLQQADLRGANLQEALLFNANLQQADLSGANLQKAYLSEVNLQKAGLLGANLQDAILDKANLQQAVLRDANLKEAVLSEANLKEAVLGDVNMQQAELDKANLQQAVLRNVNLQEAILSESNLQESDLNGANMQGAILQEANLHRADLSKANLQNTVLDGIQSLSTANLRYAKLEGATGLLGNEFAQADVTGTKLPDDIKDFKALEIVKETSQNARKIFFAMLLGCVYSWLTIATTTDVRLLTNTASSPLPIIGTEIPIAWFYIAAPLVLICLYFYFHLYLDNLWEGLGSLPAIFPDGKRLDQRAYPWLLNTLVRKYFKRLKKRSFIARMKEWITIFLAWWVVPITMVAFWLRFIPRHDWYGTTFHIGLIVLSVAFAIIFYRLCALTLQGKKKVSINLKKFWSDKEFYYSVLKIILFSVFIFFVGLLFSLLSVGAINGIRPEKNYKPVLDDFNAIEKLVQWAFEQVDYNVFADFREKEVSEKPVNYWEITEKNQLKSVKGANLKGRNLNNADMYKAFLVKADFRNASLKGANLYKANLQEADLYDANLQEAKLFYANLQQAILMKAELQKANLKTADLQLANLILAELQEAELNNANLQQAYLMNANLQQTNLLGANLQDAYFTYADLTGAKNLAIEQLSRVKTLYQAKLDPELLEQVKNCCPHLLEEPKEETDKTK